MGTDYKVLQIIMIFLIISLVILIGILLLSRLFQQYSQPSSKMMRAFYRNRTRIKDKSVASEYLSMKRTITYSNVDREEIEKTIALDQLEAKYLKQITYRNKIKRTQAAVYLGLIGNEKARLALEQAVVKEKNYSVKLYMASALSDIGHKNSIPVLISTLINAHRFYRDKVNMLIAEFGEDFSSYIPQLMENEHIEIKELIIDFSTVYYSEAVMQYLLRFIDNWDNDLENLRVLFSTKQKNQKRPPVSIDFEHNYRKLLYKTFSILATYYPKLLHQDKYLHSSDNEIQNIAIRSLANYHTPGRMQKLLSFLSQTNTSRSAVLAISMIIENNPSYLYQITKQLQAETNNDTRKQLANILAKRIEYIIMKLNEDDLELASVIIKEIMMLGRNSEIIDFLNKNKNTDIENELIKIIKDVISQNSKLKAEYTMYLNERITKKCGLTKEEVPIITKTEKKDPKLIITLYCLLLFSILLFPAIFVIRHWESLFIKANLELFKIFIVDFNYYLAYYSLSINGIYLILLSLSYINIKKQVKLWNIKKISLLFKKKMLPSVSVIAPAYNESKTIIESANSLLNLKYPDYELIIVNDGSKDNTLDVLIKYFDLTRVDYMFDYKLNTKPVRGIYMNRSLPKLIVIDKENGGKADSLNTGINISTKEYFCGIDSDSLLEDEALLKLASLTLDESIETPALGGNVFPVNGCHVDMGMIKNINIPKNKLAIFQTVEYIRAFMAGRLGWSHINGLLIISGAFGLFRKERVIGVGGYLSSSGKYHKDTVGEDMELVVRISRFMRESGNRYRICYAFNANCWTEVPEDISTLRKQRFRWQKGLIDILTYHKNMLFNPKYGKTGMIATPYYFIFEMVGPLIEIQGYVMVGLAVLLGLLNNTIALLLFISTIMMGVIISVSSLLIAEKENKYFSIKDLITLILFSIIENFGPRQLFSFWRVGAFFSMLRKPSSWDKAERKGFASSQIE